MVPTNDAQELVGLMLRLRWWLDDLKRKKRLLRVTGENWLRILQQLSQFSL